FIDAAGSTSQPYGPMFVANRVRALARQIVSSTHDLTTLTLGSLEKLARGLRPFPGRKVVVLFSNGFFMGPERCVAGRDVQAVADAAVRSGAVVYAIDARGLVSAVAIGEARVGGTYDMYSDPGVRERIELRAVQAARDGLNALAVDTGG